MARLALYYGVHLSKCEGDIIKVWSVMQFGEAGARTSHSRAPSRRMRETPPTQLDRR